MPRAWTQSAQAFNTAAAAAPIAPLARWQLSHPGADRALRIVLPVAAFFAWRRGHKAIAVAAAGVGAALWANKVLA